MFLSTNFVYFLPKIFFLFFYKYSFNHLPLFLSYSTSFITHSSTLLCIFFHPVHQVDGGMAQRTEDPSHSQSSHPVIASTNLTDRLKSSEISEKDSEEPDREIQGRDSFHGTQLTDKERINRERGEAEGDDRYTITVIGNGLHPPTAAGMDQPKPAEQQGGDLGLAQEKEAKVEEGEREVEVEVAVEALEMKHKGDEEEKEKQKERDSDYSQKALPVETLVSGAELEVKQLHQEAPAEWKLHEESQVQYISEYVGYLKL